MKQAKKKAFDGSRFGRLLNCIILLISPSHPLTHLARFSDISELFS